MKLSAWRDDVDINDASILLGVVRASQSSELAFRNHVPSPSWTANIGGMATPFHLLKAAEQMPRLRAWCEAESPEPLRRRKLFAPPDYRSEV